MKAIIILVSLHHKNTEKIAKVFAEVLRAEIKSPMEITPEELNEFDLIGFGSGIYSDKHHKSVINFAKELPENSDKKAFIFSTDGAPRFFYKYDNSLKEKIHKDHTPLRDILITKGYLILDEFNCAGYNTNKFIKLFGGINKGRPNADDLINARKFAQKLVED